MYNCCMNKHKRNQNGFHHLGILVIVVLFIIGFVGFAVYKKGPGTNTNSSTSGANSSTTTGSGPNYSALPKCSNQPPFNTLPTTLADYEQITPLGNVNVPDHTQPTDHLYFEFKRTNNMPTNPSLFAPGKIVVTTIENSGEKINGTQLTDDYALFFTPCKGMSFTFGHVQSLAGKLADSIANGKWDSECQIGHQAAGIETHYCTKKTDILLSAGDLIGKVGGKAQIGAFDLNAYKTGYVDKGYIDTRFVPSPNAVCALDYFDSTTKAQLYAIIKRTVEPRCGSVGQDKANTLQGGWYNSNNPQEAMQNWNGHLSIVHDNYDPSIGLIGVGGTISDPSKLSFAPRHTGSINREPGETSAGIVYCYQDEKLLTNNSNTATGKYLFKLTDNTSMQAEHKDGTCNTTEELSNPTSFYR